MPTAQDLRQDIWHCLRFWLFDYYFSASYPYPPASDYGFTPLVFHALSHWKLWMARKPGLESIQLEARYKRAPYDDESKCRIQLCIPPDDGEFRNHDFLLRKFGSGEPEVLCAVESEYGELVQHLTEDLGKRLLAVRSPLKVMVYRMPYREKVAPADGFAERKQAIEAMLASDPSYIAREGQPQEDWLFIGFPWYRKGWPTRKEDTFVKLWVLSTPCDSPPSLAEPEWDLWQPDPEMDHWFRSLYPLAGG